MKSNQGAFRRAVAAGMIGSLVFIALAGTVWAAPATYTLADLGVASGGFKPQGDRVTSTVAPINDFAVDIGGSKFYYTTGSPEYALKSANVDGSGVTTLLPDDGVSGWNYILVDAVNAKLYFYDAVTKSILKSNLGGSGKQTIITSSSPTWGIAYPSSLGGTMP